MGTEIKNDSGLAFCDKRSLEDKVEGITISSIPRYESGETSERIPGDNDCSKAYRKGVDAGNTVKETITDMCNFMEQVGIALDEADKEAERFNLNNFLK
jgi:hypothetical protein